MLNLVRSTSLSKQVLETILFSLVSSAMTCGCWNFGLSMMSGKEQSGNGYHISIFPAGPEFDRALLLLVLGKTRTLVKELKKDTIQKQPQ